MTLDTRRTVLALRAMGRATILLASEGARRCAADHPDQTVSLSDRSGQRLILGFYPTDWSPAPRGEVARAYGVHEETEGVAERALCIIERDCTIAWSYRSPMGINPGAEGILDALERLDGGAGAAAGGAPVSRLSPPVSARDHLRGDRGALVLLAELGDLECPFCGQAYLVVKALEEHFGARLAHAFRHLPLTQAHPHALVAAEAAEAAAAQGRFWEMHALRFQRQDALDLRHLLARAEALELELEDLRDALVTHRFSTRIREDSRSGARSSVNGTPTFLSIGSATTAASTSR
jgi:protein-disulfide isomerase